MYVWTRSNRMLEWLVRFSICLLFVLIGEQNILINTSLLNWIIVIRATETTINDNASKIDRRFKLAFLRIV